MNKITLLFCCFFNMVHASDEKTEQSKPAIKQHVKIESDKTKIKTEKLPDKELLLFLSEFSDTQGDWIDPEVFNQSYTETTDLNIELEENKK